MAVSLPPEAAPAPSSEPEWAPRIWQGFGFFAWLRLLVRNHCAVHPRYFHVAFIITLVSLCHTALRLIQDAWLAGRAEHVRPRSGPLFIVGHWRTGTTLLHELLILDPRHTFPNTYQCLAPHHFLLTERLFTRLFRWALPSHRPMDNMPAGWERPQEDEFALCMLGQPSPYLTIAFPNNPPQDQEAFDLTGLSPSALSSWKRAFLQFLGRLTLNDPRRLVLKSPTHSCRIPILLELFPDARFVHIVRNPYAVFPSTVNLWKTLYASHGLQVPTFAGLEEYVYSTFTHLYDRIEEAKRVLPPGHFHEMRYEELLADPPGQLRRMYECLELGDFEPARPAVENYLKEQAGYQTNRFKPLPARVEAEITRRWGEVIRRYGYERKQAARDVG
jgi:omega-hydroxy-beta-dihydromenaquinone-9 sulfotransferase